MQEDQVPLLMHLMAAGAAPKAAPLRRSRLKVRPATGQAAQELVDRRPHLPKWMAPALLARPNLVVVHLPAHKLDRLQARR
ncbi:MAG: hypothetical protein ACUVST_09200, partial [Anaerolineae bacterium]